MRGPATCVVVECQATKKTESAPSSSSRPGLACAELVYTSMVVIQDTPLSSACYTQLQRQGRLEAPCNEPACVLYSTATNGRTEAAGARSFTRPPTSHNGARWRERRRAADLLLAVRECTLLTAYLCYRQADTRPWLSEPSPGSHSRISTPGFIPQLVLLDLHPRRSVRRFLSFVAKDRHLLTCSFPDEEFLSCHRMAVFLYLRGICIIGVHLVNPTNTLS